MKRIAKRHLQRQQEQPKTPQPFFTPDTGKLPKNSDKPFFQRQARNEETEEKVQTLQRAKKEERETVAKKGAEEEKIENTPVMRQTSGSEEKEQQPKQ
jgi:hypothetical protein